MMHNNDELKEALEGLEDNKYYAMVITGFGGHIWYYVNGPFPSYEDMKNESLYMEGRCKLLHYGTGKELKGYFSHRYLCEKDHMLVFDNFNAPSDM